MMATTVIMAIGIMILIVILMIMVKVIMLKIVISNSKTGNKYGDLKKNCSNRKKWL